jgi:predicted outer membrane repeat protein
VDAGGTLSVSACTFRGCAADFSGNGGALFNLSGTVTIAASTFSGNSCGRDGGTLGNDGGQMTVTGSTFSGSSANYGGIIYNGGTYAFGGTLTVTGCALSGGTANGGGGGLSNDRSGVATVSGSTFSGNSASNGGGLYDGYLGGPALTVSNSTVSGNSAGFGGGVYDAGSGPAALTNVTVTANRATGYGGGLYSSGLPVLHNTLVAGNFAGSTGSSPDDVYGPLDLAGDYNLIGAGAGLSGLSNGTAGNLIGTAASPLDPGLGPLADNGGPTQTHALLPASVARGAGGTAYAAATDQRGLPRVVGGLIDVGAYQTQGAVAGPRGPSASPPACSTRR